MQINKFIIPEKFLSSISEDEKIFAVQLGYFLNEINILHKCIRIKKPKVNYEPEKGAYFCSSLMFIRLLASKLYAAREMINNAYKNKELSERLEKILSGETKAIRKKINKHFEKNHNLKNIRNHFGFHYDQKIIKEGLTETKEWALTYFTSEYAENSLFVFSEEIVFEALKKKIVCSEGNDFLLTLLQETDEICDLFREFAMNCLDKIAKANNIDLEPEVINIPDPPSYNDIHFPFFIRRDGDE